jgi:hydrogenase nickel incorporation protein HypB
VAARRNIQAVRPGMEVFKVSAKTGEGMAVYLEFLEAGAFALARLPRSE